MSTAAACERVWEHYVNFDRLDRADCAAIQEGRSTDVRQFAQQWIATLTYVRHQDPSLPSGMRRYLTGFLGIGLNQWRSYLEQAEYADALVREVVLVHERAVGWADRLIASRQIDFADPDRPSKRAQCVDSVQVFDKTVYTFDGAAGLFFLICGTPGSRALGVLLPHARTIVEFSDEPTSALRGSQAENLIGSLLRRVCRRVVLYHRARSRRGDNGGPRQIALMAGKAQNFAHHVFNYFPAVERVIAADLVGNISELRCAGSDFFGDLKVVFPELDAVPMRRSRRTSVWDPYPFSSEWLIVPTAGYFAPAHLITRLIDCMEQTLVRPEHRNRTPEGRDITGPVVWISLRTGDKSWANQADELPRLIDLITERHPEARVVLDGYAKPVGRDEISSSWRPVRQALLALVKSVRAAVKSPDAIINLVDASLREAVLWAVRADAYLAPPGTSGHKVSWFSGGKGVLYCSAPGAEEFALTRFGYREVEGVPLPRLLIGTIADEGHRKNETDRRQNIANVSFTAEQAWELLSGQISVRSAPLAPS